MPKNNKAIFKFNGGLGALLCNHCRKIIKIGHEFTEEENQAMKGKAELGPQYCDTCGPNKVTYHNRHRDKIIFEHVGDKVIMTGGSWFRYGWPNVYDTAYEKYVESALVDAGLQGNQILTQKEFEGSLFNTRDEDKYESNALYKLFGRYIYSDMKTICFVDPSGGPYISVGDNLNKFWAYGDDYQDLIVESIRFKTEGTEEKDYKSVVIFKIKKNDTKRKSRRISI